MELEIGKWYECISDVFTDGEVLVFKQGKRYKAADKNLLWNARGNRHFVTGEIARINFENFFSTIAYDAEAEPSVSELLSSIPKIGTGREEPESVSSETKPESILQEAERILGGDRATDYGDMRLSFTNIAAVWSIIAKTEITPEQVGLMMVGLKLVRQANKHKRDNLTDLAGYAECINRITEEGE